MYGNAHKSAGAAFMILRRLNLHRCRRIVNQTLALPNTFLLPAQHDEPSPEVNISATQVLLAMATALCLAGPLVWMFVRYWLFEL
jgi:hypothetical protein